jgi:uncharacterized protein (DUF1778 family)
MNKNTKDERIYIRVTPEQKTAISQAAASSNSSITAFIVQHAVDAAEEILRSQQHYVLNSAQWDLFVEALEQPAMVVPEILALMSEPSILETGERIQPKVMSPACASAFVNVSTSASQQRTVRTGNVSPVSGPLLSNEYFVTAALNKPAFLEPRVA